MSDSHREKNMATSGTYVIVSTIVIAITFLIALSYVLIHKLF